MISSIRKKISLAKNKLIPKQESKLVTPKESESMLKPRIHIGCGPVNIQGWIGIDARDASHVHVTTEVLDLSQFADSSIGEIYLCHVLEHFSFKEVEKLLKVFHNKLKEGGTLRISVPDFKLMADSYLNAHTSLEAIKFALMGGQDYEYNFHKSVYDREQLEMLLRSHGFKAICNYDTLTDFGVDLGDWSTGTIKNRPVSLNMKAKK